MAATPSIRIVKSTPYKGGAREWSNRYHFLGGTPADATHWHTLMDAVVAAEALTLPSYSTLNHAWGYAAGSDVPVADKVYSTAGSVSWASSHSAQALEVCALVRFSTAGRTTKNHPIYLFSYVHDVATDSSVTYNEKLLPSQKTALATYATAWISGFSDGTLTLTRAGPNGDAATGSVVEEYVTHRDFPYTTSL